MANHKFRIAMLSFHSCPLATLGGREAGGMNVYVRELSRELGRRGCRVDVFTRAKFADVPQVVEFGEGARVIHLKAGRVAPHDRSLLVRHVPEFVDRMREFVGQHSLGYDLIHSHYWLSGEAARALRTAWDIPVVHMSHTLGVVKNLAAGSAAEREPPQRIALEREVLRAVDCVVAATALERAQLWWFYGVPETKIAVVPCGVNLSLFRPIPAGKAKAELGLRGEKIVLYVLSLIHISEPTRPY